MSQMVAFEMGRLYWPLKQIAEGVREPRDIFMSLPGLLLYCNFARQSSAGHPINEANSTNVPPNSVPVFDAYGDQPILTLDGTDDYLSSTDTYYDLPLNEAWIAPGLRGLTVGGWIRPHVLGDAPAIISRWGDSPDYQFMLHHVTSNNMRFLVNTPGGSPSVLTTNTLVQDRWHFVAGRFSPGQTVDVWLDGEKATTATTETTITQRSIGLTIGASTDPAQRYFNGDMAHIFVTKTHLSDSQIRTLHDATRMSFI